MTETAPTWPHERPTYDSLAAAIQGEAARWNVPGMTAAVLHEGTRDSAAAGVTNLDHPAPVTPETRFQVGSISKVFTATAIMTLVDEGKVDLDAPITTWVPNLPLARNAGLRTLTLRHLLNHTTGFEGDVFFDTGAGDDALERGMARFDRLRQWTVPGEVFAYCNTGFYLAGRVIEIVTGQRYEDAVTERVIAPLGLDQTSFASADLVTVPTASGHTLKDRASGYAVYRPWALPRVVNAAGGIVSTVGDLLDFAELHLCGGERNGRRILSADAVRAMRERTSRQGAIDVGYGIGWNVQHLDGVALVGHGGATNGFRAHLVTVPERGFALAMLTNGDAGSSAMEEIRRWALQRWLGLDVPQREVADADPATLDGVAGRYGRHDARYDIARVDDHLHIARRTIEHEDQFSNERHEDDAPVEMDAWPTGDGVYRVLEGPFRDTLVEFFETRLFTGAGDALESRPVMRASGRLAERAG
jgi:CubicO group peptidase (beta-lactamase class C family)